MLHEDGFNFDYCLKNYEELEEKFKCRENPRVITKRIVCVIFSHNLELDHMLLDHDTENIKGKLIFLSYALYLHTLILFVFL